MTSSYMSAITKSVLIFFLVIGISGCSSKTPEGGMDMPPISNSIDSHRDIVLPSDLKWDSSESMAIKTASFSGGIYQYSGRVELVSLKDFIKTSMANNKWKLVGEASYESTMLAFTKPNKTCMITVSEGFGGFLGKTIVKLHVTYDLAAAKGLNPFGEPIN